MNNTIKICIAIGDDRYMYQFVRLRKKIFKYWEEKGPGFLNWSFSFSIFCLPKLPRHHFALHDIFIFLFLPDWRHT